MNNSRDFLFESSFKKFQQQILLSLVGCVVVQCEYHTLDELGCLRLWHLEDKKFLR